MSKKIIGITFLLTSSLFYGLYGIFYRSIGAFGPFSQGWVRNLLIIIFVSILFLIDKAKWKKIEKRDLKWFLIWILPASIQPILTFIAFNHLPIATTYFLNYSTMILGGIISGRIFFSEKSTPSKIFAILLVLVGLFIIYGSEINFIANIYVICALLSGLILGFWNTLSKKVSNNYSEFQMIILDCFSTVVIGLIGSIVMKESLPTIFDPNTWIWVVVFALVNICATFSIIRGFKNVEAQVGSIILPMEIVFASIFGFIFFKEVLKFNIYLGGFFILFAAIVSNLKLAKS